MRRRSHVQLLLLGIFFVLGCQQSCAATCNCAGSAAYQKKKNPIGEEVRPQDEDDDGDDDARTKSPR